MDDFLEQVVARKRRGASEALYYAAWIFLAVFAFVGLTNLTGMLYTGEDGGVRFSAVSLALGAAFLGAAFLLWKATFTLRTEYDYSFTNGVIDVARVMNRKKRAFLTTVETKELRAAGEAGSAVYQKWAREDGVKLHKWYVNGDAKLYFFAFERKGARHLMLLELNEEMAKLIFSRRYMPASAWDGAYRGV
ncbi:MAG: hypothetical protein GX647_10145 [Clostridiales bacterium]|jgi:hypothetical protein|nr:hypothetical protein [Clostridiales bacterium]